MRLSTQDLGILSDDLTGACDVAGYFVGAAGPVHIRLTPRTFNGTAPGLSVVNLQSRRMAPDESRAASARAGRELTRRRVVFLKIDTAFRGPVGASPASTRRT